MKHDGYEEADGQLKVRENKWVNLLLFSKFAYFNASKQKMMHLLRKNKARLVSEDNSQKWLMSFRILRQAALFMCLSTSPAMAWSNPYAASLTPVKLQAG